MNNFSSKSDEELMKIFNELNEVMIRKSKTYNFFHIFINSRKRASVNQLEQYFYYQFLTLYHVDVEIHLRFDPILIRLVKLFETAIYRVISIDIPLNKKPKIRYRDDGEYLQEKLDFRDTDEIFVPRNLCQNINKANEFVDKIEMISWKGIVDTYEIWDEEWIKYFRGKLYHLSYEKKQTHKDNPEVKRQMLVRALLEMDKSVIEELVNLHGEDKQTLLQAIIDIYELMQEKLL